MVYVVFFDEDNGQKPIEIEVEKGKPVKEPKAPIREGANFLGWFELTLTPEKNRKVSKTAFDFSLPIQKDITLLAKYDNFAPNFFENKPNAEVRTGGSDLRVMSYNILNGAYEADNSTTCKKTKERVDFAVDVVGRYLPDVVGFQEAGLEFCDCITNKIKFSKNYSILTYSFKETGGLAYLLLHLLSLYGYHRA